MNIYVTIVVQHGLLVVAIVCEFRVIYLQTMHSVYLFLKCLSGKKAQSVSPV